ncbi:MAG: hypothetical protein J2P14_14550 [Acidothermales bacterium]|nr:hypothetical protein [Acidothermales bacterium]
MTGTSQHHAPARIGSHPEPTRRSRRHLALLTVHVASAVALLGTDLVLLALGVSGARGADPRTVYPAASLAASWLVAPLAFVALGTGVVQAVVRSWGLVRYWWTTVKLVTTAAFTLLVLFVLTPGLADRAAAAMDGAALTTAQRLPLAIVPAVAVAAIVVNIVLGLAKPRARLRRG